MRPALARWLLALGIVATLAANVAQGWSHGPVGAVVAVWPAASLVGSYELLLWLVRTAGEVAVVRESAVEQPVSLAGTVVSDDGAGEAAAGSADVDEAAVAGPVPLRGPG